jgi:hypothetical protein
MELLLIGLASAGISVIVVPLAVLRSGIRRLDRASSLTCQPPGFRVALVRRVLGLHARIPAHANRCDHAACQPPFTIGNGRPWIS